MIKYYLLLMMLLIEGSNVFGQNDKPHYKNICGTIRKNNSKLKGSIEVKASTFLDLNQVYLYLFIPKSDTISLYLNGTLVKKDFLNVLSDRTGDHPDYGIKINVKNKRNILTLYFDNDKSFFKIPIKRKYKVYGIAYKTGVWGECIYVEMKNFYSF